MYLLLRILQDVLDSILADVCRTAYHIIVLLYTRYNKIIVEFLFTPYVIASIIRVAARLCIHPIQFHITLHHLIWHQPLIHCTPKSQNWTLDYTDYQKIRPSTRVYFQLLRRAPAFGRGFFCPSGKKESLLCCFRQLLAIFGASSYLGNFQQ